MACPLKETCPLIAKLTGTFKIWQKFYCDTDVNHQACARYKLVCEGKPMPITLLPNGETLEVSLECGRIITSSPVHVTDILQTSGDAGLIV